MKLEICNYFCNGKYEDACNDDTCTSLKAYESDVLKSLKSILILET